MNIPIINCLNTEQLLDLLARLEKLYFMRRLPKNQKLKPEVIGALKELGYTEEEIFEKIIDQNFDEKDLDFSKEELWDYFEKTITALNRSGRSRTLIM